jgi:hypothetical protein
VICLQRSARGNSLLLVGQAGNQRVADGKQNEQSKLLAVFLLGLCLSLKK